MPAVAAGFARPTTGTRLARGITAGQVAYRQRSVRWIAHEAGHTLPIAGVQVRPGDRDGARDHAGANEWGTHRPGQGLAGSFAYTAASAAANAASASSAVVSRTTASGAGRSGAAARAASWASRARISASTPASVDGHAASLQFQPAAAGALGQAGGDEQLRRRVGKDHRADVAAVQHRAAAAPKPRWNASRAARHAGMAATAAAAASACGPRRSVRRMSVGGTSAARRLRHRRIGGVAAGIQHAAADRAIQQAGIEIGQVRARRRAGAPACPCRPRPGRRWR